MKKEWILVTGMMFLAGCGTQETLKTNTPQPAEEKRENSEVSGKVNSEDKTKTEKVDELTSEQDQLEVESREIIPQYKMNDDDFSIQKKDNPNEQIVLLTIDDAPDKNSLEMAKKLKELGVKAIFFVNGHFIDTPEEGEILKQINQMGFPIGNHTYSHKSLKELTPEEQRHEIIGLNDRIEELIGERPRFFRAPFGLNTDISRRIAAEENMLVMNWTYGYDWEKDYQSKDKLANIMVNTPLLRTGANLLMHDRKWTSEALPDIVKGIQEKGFTIIDPDLIETP